MYLIELGANFQLVVVLPRCKKTQFKLKLNKTKEHKANQKHPKAYANQLSSGKSLLPVLCSINLHKWTVYIRPVAFLTLG